MRRGHQGIGGWHNDNPRHFRPRNGGNPHYRPPKNLSSLNSNRFPPSDTRFRRPHLKSRTGSDDHLDQEYHERNRYRQDSHFTFSRSKDKTSYKNDRHILPMIQHMKHGGSHSNYKVGSHSSEVYSINSMGDIDQRQIHINKVHPVPPWSIDNHFHDIDDRAYNKTYRDGTVELNKPHPDYAGHRPPASDHYGGNPIPTNENSKTFSRSVDDTVNIVRKRLLSRGETHQAPDTSDTRENTMEHNVTATPTSSQYEQLIKRKTPKPNKVNCDKIKNKIFHQLFKMDKEKIHKLLDNPSSSTKFEYAINSLLTESQNSFNQHLRSVAEKSLCTSSKDFMQNDNNTIYEDTFMKQMQCILDPQDTVLLEDIKPVVMAELSNLLQFDDVDSRCYPNDNHHNFSHYQDSSTAEQYPQDSSTAEQYSQDYREQPAHSYDSAHNPGSCDNVYFENLSSDYPNFGEYEAQVNSHRRSFEDSKPLFERRARRKSCTFTPDINTASDRTNHLKRVDSKFIEKYSKDSFMSGDKNKPLFDANTDFTEAEDIFAELDKQYHVAVDHDFIEYDDLSNPIKDSNDTPQPQKTLDIPKTPLEMKQDIDFPKTPIKVEQLVKKEIDCQLQDIASVELDSLISLKNESECKNNKEYTNSQHVTSSSIKSAASQQSLSSEIEIKNKSNDSVNSENSAAFKINPSFNSRKRSIDQRPSHRKEKRKKSEENDDSGKNKSLNINDSMLKEFTELKQSKEQNSNSEKKSSSSEKIYSEKYVKRKKPQKKMNSNEDRKRQNSTSSSHSTSPKNNNTLINQPTSKSDTKNSLKTIDMFTEVPKKINIHQAFRNTALNVTPKKIAEIKPKPIFSLNQKHQKKHDVGTQVIKRILSKETQTLDSKSSTSRFCQTDKKKLATKSIQTDIQPDKHKESTKSTDAFERMKEIDLEIQVLLQEKFKLYSSMESKEGTIPMHNLGMTVLNVSSFDDNKEDNENLEDALVNNFTNIPEDELEQIAFETVETSDQPLASRRNKRRKNSYSSVHSGSTSSCTRRNKKSQTPNISLIEQIITDDRPLEDIISLDDLEVTPVTSKKKQKPKKRTISKKKNKTMENPDQIVLRECYVLLLREDLSKYYTSERTRSIEVKNYDPNIIPSIPHERFYEVIETEQILNEGEVNHCENLIEETVVSDLQFDMLDVSEDIVIGENYEEKSTDEKEVIEHLEVPISEEIILDNSQSSIEDATIQVDTQGGECKLYDYLSDENLQRDSLVVSGNADAVLAIECVGQNFLAAGLDGNVYYFSSDGQIITTLRGSNLAVTCLCIVKEKFGTTVYTGSLDSRIRNYDLETGLEKGPECNVLSPIQTMDRAWDTVFVGTRTGFVLQFECKNNMLIPVSTVKFSDQSILALRAMKEGPRKVLLVAARSENVTIKDAQTGLLLRTLSGPKMTVYTLLFEDGKVYCGTSSHQIQVFDYTSGAHVGTHEGGKGAVCLRAAGGLLFAGCYDGCVYVYREGEPRPFAQLRGPSLMLLCLAVVGTKIIVGFKDRSLYIWKIPLCILQEMIL